MMINSIHVLVVLLVATVCYTCRIIQQYLILLYMLSVKLHLHQIDIEDIGEEYTLSSYVHVHSVYSHAHTVVVKKRLCSV